jgi:hypothetical protein
MLAIILLRNGYFLKKAYWINFFKLIFYIITSK